MIIIILIYGSRMGRSEYEGEHDEFHCLCVCVCVCFQGILQGEVSLYCWPPVRLVWISLFFQIKTKIVSSHTADSKPVKQEVNHTMIQPPLVFPGVSVCVCVCVVCVCVGVGVCYRNPNHWASFNEIWNTWRSWSGNGFRVRLSKIQPLAGLLRLSYLQCL